MSRPDPKDVDTQDAFERETPIDEAMNQAFRDAVLAHKRAGVPLVPLFSTNRVRLDDLQSTIACSPMFLGLNIWIRQRGRGLGVERR